MIKVFHILKGIVTGLTTSRHFTLFFDWFYPEYFQLVHKALTPGGYLEDDELTLTVFKFLAELLNNRCSRLRFDTWNINGLILF